MWALRTAEWCDFMAFEDGMDGFQSNAVLMLSAQFPLDPPCTKIAFPAEREDPVFFLFEDLVLGSGFRAAALGH